MNDSREGDIQEVLRAVAEATARPLNTLIDVSPLQQNYFSFIFFVRWQDGAGYAVKLPRTDLRLRAGCSLRDITAADRALAAAEIDSLKTLAAGWDGLDVNVRWVSLVAELPEWAALVTDFVDAVDVCEAYRRLALSSTFGGGRAQRGLVDRMARLGTALGRFHRHHGRECAADTPALGTRIVELWRRLPSTSRNPMLAKEITHACEWLSATELPDMKTLILKGIDVRNLLEGRDGALWLLDPGKSKWASREADVARFVLTWRILFWGTPWFAVGLQPPAASGRAFTEACDGPAAADRRLRGAYFLKEVLKHWLTAHDSLQRRAMGRWSRRLVGRVYIDRFYQQEARLWLRELS